MNNDKSHQYTNQLINETSPYLLQHAHNPVDWHPWGAEALEKAKKENKLLIISIGYAACHWCHVMEHESFEDSTVAAIMNEYFVPIKVDREERPDVDDVYMAAAQLVSGRGGWPLNAFALPDGRPIWAGTYFPKERWMDILQQFANLKDKSYDRLVTRAEHLTQGIGSLDEIVVAEATTYTQQDMQKVGSLFLSQIDYQEGGRSGAPKFPMPNNYDFLLKYALLMDDPQAIDAVKTTLNSMALGGIYDQVGGGFARYAVDSSWLVPHFEKMTYDNGQLISLYSQAYRFAKEPLYEKIIRQTLEFMEREMTSPEGGFYSSLDADSEGMEGKFYVWTSQQIDTVIHSLDDRILFKDFYSVDSQGNWEHGNNILHISQDINEIARRYNMTTSELWSKIAQLNAELLQFRETRVRPGLDDKILTSWNALMAKGYIDAYKALGHPDYLYTAERNLHFIIKNQMDEDFRLNRNYKEGRSTINGFLDDYALLIDALLAMYEVTLDESWLDLSQHLTDYTLSHFYDDQSQMFFYTSDIDPPLIARKMELSDNVIPASNSVMARNLRRLGSLLEVSHYLRVSDQMLANMWSSISAVRQPSFYSNWLQLLIEHVFPIYEVAIVGPDAVSMTKDAMQSYHPNATFLGTVHPSKLPLLTNKYVNDVTMIYVCQNKTCRLPVTEIDKALQQMRRQK